LPQPSLGFNWKNQPGGFLFHVCRSTREEALELLEEVKNRPNHGFSNASEVALIYAGLGEKDQALTWLEKNL
jgi:hypothetical protein